MSRQLAVLMTAYNAEHTIGRAIESLKRGSEPFALLIVDDCSTRPVAEVIGTGDPSIEIIRTERNLGVARAKNLGLSHLLAQPYEFIAMMDADDVSAPERLAKQAAFLMQNPDVALVGSWVRYIDENTREVLFHFKPPCAAQGIQDALFFNNCIVHPTWMVRARALRATGLYAPEYTAAEDYELLRRMSTQFKLANLPEFLVDYTISMSGVSVTRRHRQLVDRLRIQAKYFDPRHLNAWIGMLRTAAMLLLPRRIIPVWWSGASAV